MVTLGTEGAFRIRSESPHRARWLERDRPMEKATRKASRQMPAGLCGAGSGRLFGWCPFVLIRALVRLVSGFGLRPHGRNMTRPPIPAFNRTGERELAMCSKTGVHPIGHWHAFVWCGGGVVAEEVGFEPTVGVNPRRFSRPVHSTTLPLLRRQSDRPDGTILEGKPALRHAESRRSAAPPFSGRAPAVNMRSKRGEPAPCMADGVRGGAEPDAR